MSAAKCYFQLKYVDHVNRAFSCQCLLSCEKCEVLSAVSFRTWFLNISALCQTKNCYVMKTWKDTMWNKEASFLANVYPTFTLYSQDRRPGTKVSLMPRTSPLPTNPWVGVSRLQQPYKTDKIHCLVKQNLMLNSQAFLL